MPFCFHENVYLAAEQRVAALPVHGADVIDPVRQGPGLSRHGPHQFVKAAVVDDQPFVFDVPAMLIQVAAQGTGIALGLQDDKFQRLPDRIGSLEYPHHQRAAHATDDSAIDFPCFDAGQAVTQAAVDAVGQAGTGR